jgi:Leucine-rich repeat (LRR) protein
MAQAQINDSSCTAQKVYYSIADALKEPDQVKYLDLSMNKLTAFPMEILQFKNLECLDLSFNRIPTLPAELTQLSHLHYINLMGTRYMAKAPAVLGKIPSLKTVDLSDHPEWSAATFNEAKALMPNVKIIK